MIQQEGYKKKYFDGSGHSFDASNPEEAGFLSRAEYAYGMYCSDIMSTGFGGYSRSGISDKLLMDYYFGRQPVSIYQDAIDPLVPDPNVPNSKGYRKLNINWKLPRPLSKPLNILESTLTGLIMDVGTQANDPSARHEKDSLIGDLKHLSHPMTKSFVEGTGMKVPEMEQVKGFSGPEDIDFLNSVGGIRMATEIMMKDGIDVTMYESRWESMDSLFARDIIAKNKMCYNVYTDMSTGRVMVEYIDPSRAFSDVSIYEDHRDSGTMGFIRTTRISEVRQRMGGMDPEIEKRLRDAAGNYSNMYGNRQFSKYGNQHNRNYLDREIDDALVDVMTLYFVDTEPTRYAERRYSDTGKHTMDKMGLDSTVKHPDSKQHDYCIHKLYKVSWVVGSKIVFDFGEVEDMVREGQPGNKRIVHNMYLYIGDGPSITEQCMGPVDDICIATFKMRQAVKDLPPGPRLLIDLNGLETGFKMDGKQYSLTDELRNLSVDGKMVIRSKSEYTMPGDNSGTARSPINPLLMSVFEDINMFSMRIQQETSNIQYIAGFNPTTSGDAVAPDMLKHVAEAAIRSTNAANAPLIDVWRDAYERLCQIVGKKWQNRLLHGDITYDNLPTASGTMKVAKLAKELAFHDWNIFVRVDTTGTKDLLVQDLMSKKDFIAPDVYYIILNCITQNDLVKAQVLLGRHINKAKEEEHRKMLEIQQAQASGNQQAAVAGEEARMKTEREAGRQKVLQIQEQMKADLIVLAKKHEYGMTVSQ